MSAPIESNPLVEKLGPIGDWIKQNQEAQRAREEEHRKEMADLRGQLETLKNQSTERMADLLGAKGLPRRKELDPEAIATKEFGDFLRSVKFGRSDKGKAAQYAADKGYSETVQKALSASIGTEGGYLVPEILSSDFIDLLRPMSVIRSSQPVMVPMPNGVLPLPKLTAGSTAEYVGESATQNASQPTFGQVRLVWKKLRSIVPTSNELLRFAQLDADTIIRDDILRGIATREDVAFIRDNGTSNAPKGLRHWAPAANVTASRAANDASVPTVAEVEGDFQDLVNTLEQADVMMARPRILMAPRTKNFLAILRDASNGTLIFPDMNSRTPSLWGIPVGVTTNIPTNLGAGTDGESEIYLADFADVLLGQSSEIEVAVSDEASYRNSGGTLVSAFERDETVWKVGEHHDFAMRHDESVAVKTGVVYGAN